MTHQIPLQQGAFALVDAHDYEQLTKYNWFLSKAGYAVGFVPSPSGKFALAYMHRLILKPVDGQLVDHINGNPLDNRRENLRSATSRQNHQNRRVSSHSTTGLKGVSFHAKRNKYHARIQLQGMRYHLGYYHDAETAALAYDVAARWLFGEFALCNYPDKKTPRWVADSVAQRLAKRGMKVG